MNILVTYLFRNMLGKKLRSIIMIFAIALTTFLLLLNLGVRQHFEQSYDKHMRSSFGTTDLLITAGEEREQKLLQSQDINWTSSPDARMLPIFFSTSSMENGTDGMIKVSTFGVESSDAETFEVVEFLEYLPGEFTGNAVAISEQTASRLGYALGDSVDLNVNGTYKPFTIHAIAKQKGFFQQESEHSISMLLPFDQANENFGTSDHFNLVYVSIPDGKSLDEYMANLIADNPILSIQSAIDENALKTQTGAIFLALAFVLIIVMIISFYIISSLFKVIMTERIPMIGTFQSIGASKLQVRMLLIGESALYGLVGAGIGTIVAFFFSPPLYRLLNAVPSVETGATAMMDVGHFLLALSFALGVSVSSSFVAIHKLHRYSTKQIILGEIDSAEQRGPVLPIIGGILILTAIVLTVINTSYNLLLGLTAIVCLLIGILLLSTLIVSIVTQFLQRLLTKLLPYEAVLGMKNVKNNKFANSNILLVTIVLTLIITIYTVIHGVQNYMSAISSANDFDISITQLDDNLDVYHFLETADVVEEVYDEYLGFGKMHTTDLDMDSMTFIGLDEEQLFKEFHRDGVHLEEQDASALFLGKNILVDRFVAEKYKLSIGDEITLSLDGAEEQSTAYSIIGFMDSSNFVTTRKSAMISLTNFQEDLTKQPFQILLKTDENRQEVKKRVVEQLINTPSAVMTLDEIIEQSTEGVDSLFMILNLFILLSVLLAGFGIINNLIISFLQRQREVAVLHSICMSKGQLNWMFFMETTGVLLFSSGLAFGLSYAICYLLPNFLWGAGIAFVFTYPIKFSLLLLAGLGVIFLLATLVPVLKLSRMRIVNHLKFD